MNLPIDFAVEDVILLPTGMDGVISVTACPHASKENFYRKHLQKNSKILYSIFEKLFLEHGAGMVTMLDQGKKNKTDCRYVPAEDCEDVAKEVFTKRTGELLWAAAKPAIEQSHWPEKVPVLALSILDKPPSFFFVHNFSELQKPKGKGFGVVRN